MWMTATALDLIVLFLLDPSNKFPSGTVHFKRWQPAHTFVKLCLCHLSFPPAQSVNLINPLNVFAHDFD